MALALMMSLTAFSGAAQAAPGVPPAAFVDANRNLVYDAGELQFATIQAAIDAAPAGGQVVVTPGTYAEQISIIKRLSLVSDPALEKPIITCPTTLSGDMAIAVLGGAGNAILVQGLIFQGPGPSLGVFTGAIMVKDDAIANIVGNVFRNIYSPTAPGNNESFAINVGHSRAGGMWISTAQARVYNNTFTACYPGAVSVAGFGSTLNLDSNDINGRGAGVAFDALPQIGVLVLDEAQAIITYNSIMGIGSTAPGGAGILVFNGADVNINNNDIIGIADHQDTSIGLRLQGTGSIPGLGSGTMNLTSAIVDSNSVAGHQTGIYALLTRQDPTAMTSPIEITYNQISANTALGLKLEAVDNVTVSYNTITGNDHHGVWVSTIYADVLVQDNNIYGNDPAATIGGGGLFNFTPLNLIDAAYNYWGSPTGPGGAWLGSGDVISEGVLCDPWYTAPVVGGSAISASGSRSTVVVDGTGTFSSANASLDLLLVGAGTYTATAMLFTGAPEPGLAKPLPRYYHFRLDTVTGLTEVTVFAKYDVVPGSMNEDSLRLYYFDNGRWQQFSNTYVDTANKRVVGAIPASSVSPSLGMLSGDFLIAVGQPMITAVPLQGPVGTNITVRGAGFLPNSLVEVTFDGVLIAHGLSDHLGDLPAITFTVPTVTPGLYEVRGTDRMAGYGITTFNVLDMTPLDIALSTYSTYYLHELVQWTFTISMDGVPTNADVLTVNLVTPTGNVPLTGVTWKTGTGQYRTPYLFAGAAGDYTLLIEARKGTTHQGDLGRVFVMNGSLPAGVVMTSLGTNDALLSINDAPHLFQRSTMNLALVQVAGTTASVASSIGGVTAHYAIIGAEISDISFDQVHIRSSIGSIWEAAALINAHAASYASGNISVQTSIGAFNVPWSNIRAAVNDVTGTTATIVTDVGSFQTSAASVHATLLRVSDIVADISTDLNVLAEAANQINATLTTVNGTTATIGSDIGSIMEDASLLKAYVTQVQGTTATIASSIGNVDVPVSEVSAVFVGISGTTANISTSLGSIAENASLIGVQVTQVWNTTAALSSTLNSLQVPAANVSASLAGINGAHVNITTSLNTVTELATLVDAHASEVKATMTKITSTVGFIWIDNAAAAATLTSITGNMANIATTYGAVVESAALVNATIGSLNNWTVVIGTAVGMVTQNVTTINALLTGFNGTMATVGTDIGPKTVTVAQISTQVTALNGDAATISTIFGTVLGTVASKSGNMANITTSIGTVTLDISKYTPAPTDNTPLIMLLALALLAVLVIVVVLRRRK